MGTWKYEYVKLPSVKLTGNDVACAATQPLLLCHLGMSGLKGRLSATCKITLKSQDILIIGDPKILLQFRFKLPSQFSETILIKGVWLRIVKMRMAAT